MGSLAALDCERRAAGLSVERVAAAAGLSTRSVLRWQSGKRKPLPHFLARYRQALRRLARGVEKADANLLIAFDTLLVLVARDHGVCPVTVRASRPALRATRSEEWVAAQRVRWEAIYLMREVFGFKPVEIAKVVGVTRQTVQQAVAAVEAARDGDLKPDIPRDAALDARLSALIRDLTEVEL